DEQPVEVEVSGLLDLASFDVNMIDAEVPPRSQRLEIEAERRDVRRKFGRRFLERDEDARLVEPDRAVDEKLRCQNRFPGSRVSADQRRSPCRQAIVGDLVKAPESCGC